MKLSHSIMLFGAMFLSISAFAEVKSVVCTTHPSFDKNSCDVCYEETFTSQTTKEGWSSDITEVKIPWKNQSGDLFEIIYSNEQELPSIKSEITVSSKPEKPEDLWENHETLIWDPFPDHKEAIVKKDEEVGLYRLKAKSTVHVEGKKPDDTIIFLAPLTVRPFDPKINQDGQPKDRNICVLGKFKPAIDDKAASAAITPAATGPKIETPTVNTPKVTPPAPKPAVEVPNLNAAPLPSETGIVETPKTDVPALNAAGPEEEKKDIPKPTVKQQTKVQTGPELWILLALAFVVASGWNAWKKQQS